MTQPQHIPSSVSAGEQEREDPRVLAVCDLTYAGKQLTPGHARAVLAALDAEAGGELAAALDRERFNFNRAEAAEAEVARLREALATVPGWIKRNHSVDAEAMTAQWVRTGPRVYTEEQRQFIANAVAARAGLGQAPGPCNDCGGSGQSDETGEPCVCDQADGEGR